MNDVCSGFKYSRTTVLFIFFSPSMSAFDLLNIYRKTQKFYSIIIIIIIIMIIMIMMTKLF